MIRATLHMKVKPGTEDEFVRAFTAIAQEVRREPGSVRQTLMRDPEDPGLFVVMTDWASRDAFTQFERSSAQDKLVAPLRALRDSATMAVYELVFDLEGGGGDANPGDGVGDDQSG